MADKRMISKRNVDTDLFLDMPMTSRLLYYDLLIRADDDGFVGSPKKITRMVGARDDDLRILVSKRFIIPFDSGICVIKDWRIHNYIKPDRYQPTQYMDEKSQLTQSNNKSYEIIGTEVEPKCIQSGTNLDTQVRLGKIRLGKIRLEENIVPDKPAHRAQKFAPPSLDEVKAYCAERGKGVGPERWYDHYQSNGWMVGKTKMKDWKAAVRTWERNEYDAGRSANNAGNHESCPGKRAEEVPKYGKVY